MDHGRLANVPQFVVNPEDTAFTNLTSTCTNTQALNLSPLHTTADVAMQSLAAAVTGDAAKLDELRAAAADAEEPDVQMAEDTAEEQAAAAAAPAAACAPAVEATIAGSNCVRSVRL
jgi:nucleoid-associated protein YgaU